MWSANSTNPAVHRWMETGQVISQSQKHRSYHSLWSIAMWVSHGLTFTVHSRFGFCRITLIGWVVLGFPVLLVNCPFVLIVLSFVFPPAILHSLFSPLFVFLQLFLCLCSMKWHHFTVTKNMLHSLKSYWIFMKHLSHWYCYMVFPP